MTRKRIIFWLIVVSGALYWFNLEMEAGVTLWGEQVRLASFAFLILTCISVVIFLLGESKLVFRSTLIIAAIFLILNSLLSSEVTYLQYRSYQYSKIYEIKTCELAEKAFYKDLENGDLRYFTFGLGEHEPTRDYLEDKYDLEVFHVGCVVDNSLICYNELVEQHIAKEKQLDFWAFMDQWEE